MTRDTADYAIHLFCFASDTAFLAWNVTGIPPVEYFSDKRRAGRLHRVGSNRFQEDSISGWSEIRISGSPLLEPAQINPDPVHYFVAGDSLSVGAVVHGGVCTGQNGIGERLARLAPADYAFIRSRFTAIPDSIPIQVRSHGGW